MKPILISLLVIVGFLQVNANGITGLQDSTIVYMSDCEDDAYICVDVPIVDFINYQVKLDGVDYQNGMYACDWDTLHTYSYSILFGMGASGPYHLDSWQIDNQIFSGLFETIPDLVDSMNTWDPAGNWMHSAGGLMIMGGNSFSNYYEMDVTVVALNLPSKIGYNQSFISNGTEIYIPKGVHQLEVIDANNGVQEMINIAVACVSHDMEVMDLDKGIAHAYCPSDEELASDISRIAIMQCTGVSSGNFDFQLDADLHCLNILPIDYGVDTVCLIICDNWDICDTTTLVLKSLQNISIISETISDTLSIGDVKSYCIDTGELPGQISRIREFCDQNVQNSIAWQLLANECVEISAEKIGNAKICVEICDNQGYCDTTSFIFHVVAQSFNGLPSLNDDYFSTAGNGLLSYNVIDNDDLDPNDILSIYLISISDGGIGPLHGQAYIENTGTLNYFPFGDVCDVQDRIEYVVCATTGCDTGIVHIDLLCETLPDNIKVYSGFSPNGDGMNDYLVINGLQDFEDYELNVYSRWGDRVYHTVDYQNDWNGNWNGNILADGTYFYSIELKEINERKTGYIYIQR